MNHLKFSFRTLLAPLYYGATLAAGYGNVAVTMPAPTAAVVTLDNGFVTAPDDLAAQDPINIPGFVTITSVITLENSLGRVVEVVPKVDTGLTALGYSA